MLAAVFGDTTFDVLKATHVLAAALWVGGNFTLNIAVNLAFLSRDPARESMILRMTEVIGQRVFTPLGLVVAAVGVWMVLRYDNVYRFEDFWVSYGLAFFIVTLIVGAGFLGPRAGKVSRQIEAGTDQDTIQRDSRTFRLVAAVDALLLWSVVVIMVVKPT
jgi:uncharacterized membrane protein